MNDDQNNKNENLEIRPDELAAPIEEDEVEFVDTDAMGDELKDKAKLKNLRVELSRSQLESRDHLTALQRARADYVNLKKELDETRENTKKKTTERIVMDFLPVLD